MGNWTIAIIFVLAAGLLGCQGTPPDALEPPPAAFSDPLAPPGSLTPPTPADAPAPVRAAPQADICDRTPAVQSALIGWFFPGGTGLCRQITGADLARINDLEITADRVAPGDLVGLDYLETLTLTLQEMPAAAVFDTPRLTDLTIGLDNDAPVDWTIPPDWLAGAPALEHLRIAPDGVETTLRLSDRAFGGAPGLTHIEVDDGGRWETQTDLHFGRSSFAGLDALTELVLDGDTHQGDLYLTDSPRLDALRLTPGAAWRVHFASYEAVCSYPPKNWRAYVNGERATLISGGVYEPCIFGVGTPRYWGAPGHRVTQNPYFEQVVSALPRLLGAQ